MPTHIIVHHTGAEEKDAAQVRKYHLSLGWRDVGYNFIIERDGSMIVGRPLNISGAHCRAGGMNSRSIGVALIGNLDNRSPTRHQTRALVYLLRELIFEHGILPERVLGHREVPGAATACPGRFVDMAGLRQALSMGGAQIATNAGNSDYASKADRPGFPLKIRGFEALSAATGSANKIEAAPVSLPEHVGPVLLRVLALAGKRLIKGR